MNRAWKALALGVVLTMLTAGTLLGFGQGVLSSSASVSAHVNRGPVQSDLKDVVLDEINSVEEKQTLEVAMGWFTDVDVARAIVDAHNRGALVHVMLRDEGMSPQGRRVCQILDNGGVRVSHRGNLHHKFAVIDEPEGTGRVITGSTNWTASGFDGEANDIVIIDQNQDIVQLYIDTFVSETSYADTGCP